MSFLVKWALYQADVSLFSSKCASKHR